MKFKKFGALLLSAVLCIGMAAPAFAYEGDTAPVEEPVLPEVVEEEDAVTITDEETGALTPEGNLTLVDDYHTSYSDGSGQQFITLVSKSGATFYLVIDRQRTENNVYFLNAVTEKDLLNLAEADPEPEVTEPVVQPEPDPEPVPEPEPEPEKDTAFPVGNLLMVAVVALVGGGAAYYFKVYRPKHEAAGLDEDDYDYDEADPYGDMETEEETEDEE